MKNEWMKKEWEINETPTEKWMRNEWNTDWKMNEKWMKHEWKINENVCKINEKLMKN